MSDRWLSVEEIAKIWISRKTLSISRWLARRCQLTKLAGSGNSGRKKLFSGFAQVTLVTKTKATGKEDSMGPAKFAALNRV